MKSFGAFKQQLNESISPEQQRLDTLVRSGLMDKTKLAKIHRVMGKLGQDQPLSTAERQMAYEMMQELLHVVTSNVGVFQKTRQALHTESVQEATDSNSVALYHHEPPPLVILRRKAIRMYPHDTKVALYYSDKLDRYFTIPFEDTEMSE
jgi:hypothetical protein